ncbi:DUF2459 domain-containing protein [Sulfurimonas sp.]|uniref:DUF2459 domain-containing protein n=1 Tax=Sulfurimonas sp. TaxID=2022749 RepID=UPI0035696565
MKLKSLTLLSLLLLTACAKPVSSFYPPDFSRTDNKTIYVVNDRWHTGIIVFKKDLDPYIRLFDDIPNRKYLEIGWGDEVYYRAKEKTLWMGFRALFLPTGSIIHVASFQQDPASYFSNSELIKLKLSEQGFIRLAEFISKSFALNEKKELVRLGKGIYGTSRFYRANGTFHIFNNCNTWSADAIYSSGFPISRYTFSAESLLEQVKKNQVINGTNVKP